MCFKIFLYFQAQFLKHFFANEATQWQCCLYEYSKGGSLDVCMENCAYYCNMAFIYYTNI